MARSSTEPWWLSSSLLYLSYHTKTGIEFQVDKQTGKPLHVHVRYSYHRPISLPEMLSKYVCKNDWISVFQPLKPTLSAFLSLQNFENHVHVRIHLLSISEMSQSENAGK